MLSNVVQIPGDNKTPPPEPVEYAPNTLEEAKQMTSRIKLRLESLKSTFKLVKEKIGEEEKRRQQFTPPKPLPEEDAEEM